MSMPILDYLPFDYTRYIKEILPIWRQALNGDVQPLQDLIATAPYFSLWPHLHAPLSRWDMFAWIIPCLGSPIDPEDISDVNLLHASLFYTFCCDLPLQEEPDQLCEGETTLIGNEDVPLWYDYIRRDATVQALWEPFYQPAPPELAAQLLRSAEVDPDWWAAHQPRGHFLYDLDERPSGFITTEEAQRIFTQFPRKQAPMLPSIYSCCVRDAESEEFLFDFQHFQTEEYRYVDFSGGRLTWEIVARLCRIDEENMRVIYDELVQSHFDEMQAFQRRYYERLWELEDKIMRRFAFAIARGWGMMAFRT